MNTLVISGANTCVFYILGVLRSAMFDDENYLQNIHSFWGTSSGSLACALVLLLREFGDVTVEAFDRLVGNLCGCLRNFNWIADFDNGYGVFDCEQMVEALLSSIGASGYRMGDFRCGELHVTAYCPELGSTQVFSCSSDLPLSRVLAMSCCIPFIFQPVVHEGMFYVDGSLLQYVPERDPEPGDIYLMMECMTGSTHRSPSWFTQAMMFAGIRDQLKRTVQKLKSSPEVFYMVVKRSSEIKYAYLPSACSEDDVNFMLRHGAQQFRDWICSSPR